MSSYRSLTPADADSAARVISQAFFDDPLIQFMLPLRWTRFQTLYKYFLPMTEVCTRRNRVFGVGEPLQGVAYWKSPDEKEMAINSGNITKFLPLLLTLFPLAYLRAKTIIDKTEEMHRRYTGEPHYFLENLGVLSTSRGKGFSSQLIRPILAQADQKKMLAYLDTVNPVNVPIYEHFGFECVEKAAIPGTGVTVFAMRRLPR
jgi:hypothetical protein